MELVWATRDFVIMGQPYPGFPILLHDSMESCVPFNRFMRYYLLRGAIGSSRALVTAKPDSTMGLQTRRADSYRELATCKKRNLWSEAIL